MGLSHPDLGAGTKTSLDAGIFDTHSLKRGE